MSTDRDTILGDYAPGGRLRFALNHGNRVLIGRDPDGRPEGISVDLARALSAELGTEPTFVEFQRATDVASSATDDVWDVCFLAVDPLRAATIAFTHPYVRIEGCYLMRSDAAKVADDVARLGLRIGIVEGSAYGLHLARAAGAEGLVTFASFSEATAALDAGEVDGVAGIRQATESEAAARPGMRVLEPPFMEIRQAMGVPAGRILAHAHLSEFLAARAADGTVAAILERHGVSGSSAILPPPPHPDNPSRKSSR
jgi:polar amino acid transport system substrate-binding protein